MRATIRQTNLTALHDDVDAAMALVDIDDSGTYRRQLVVTRPDLPPTRTEETIPGHEVRARLRVELLTTMHEVEQATPGVIEARWTRKSKRNGYRTHVCTYTRIPAPSLDRPASPPPPPSTLLDQEIPAHVTETADYIELVAEEGTAEDALDLSRQMVRAGDVKTAIDIRRTVAGGTLDRAALRKVARTVAADARREYQEARQLLALGPA
ncbi:hypothetical protein [Streptomyces sp. DH8]|uniref:hypothetical protein n=1 Tax=Streptomyces sp. DH8 TaxID=2857008 RepID=UPI001E3C4C59|nr:hypothetical protein [Streptomyces sp. DH8]